MSVSAIFGSKLVVPLSLRRGAAETKTLTAPQRLVMGGGDGGGLIIECSSRPQKKATKHHMKTRPRKTQPWDIRRGPTVYAPLPPLPPDWTLVSDDTSVAPASPPEPVQSDAQPRRMYNESQNGSMSRICNVLTQTSNYNGSSQG